MINGLALRKSTAVDDEACSYLRVVKGAGIVKLTVVPAASVKEAERG